MTRDDFAALTDLQLLAALVAGEAIGEPWLGKLAVAYSPINRLAAGHYGKTLAEVILAREQYSCFDDPHRYEDMMLASQTDPLNGTPAAECWNAGYRALTGTAPDPSNGAVNYYAPAAMKPPGSEPYWVPHMRLVAVVGNQRFYKE